MIVIIASQSFQGLSQPGLKFAWIFWIGMKSVLFKCFGLSPLSTATAIVLFWIATTIDYVLVIIVCTLCQLLNSQNLRLLDKTSIHLILPLNHVWWHFVKLEDQTSE